MALITDNSPQIPPVPRRRLSVGGLLRSHRRCLILSAPHDTAVWTPPTMGTCGGNVPRFAGFETEDRPTAADANGFLRRSGTWRAATFEGREGEFQMPAKSKARQKAAGAALTVERGEISKGPLRGASRSMAASMTERELEEMAST